MVRDSVERRCSVASRRGRTTANRRGIGESTEPAWFGVLVISDNESLQTVTRRANEQKFSKNPDNGSPIVKQVFAPFVRLQDIASGAILKRTAKVRQHLGPLGFVLSR